MKKKLYFCNAPIRPQHCRQQSNICCLQCEFKEWCLEQSKILRNRRPCLPTDFEKNEECEYNI